MGWTLNLGTGSGGNFLLAVGSEQSPARQHQDIWDIFWDFWDF